MRKRSILTFVICMMMLISFSQNMGIGTTTPKEKLDVNGAIKLGSTMDSNAGTIRFNNNKFEGNISGSWVLLSNEIHGLPSQGFASIVTRNAEVNFVSTLFTIPDTGSYLVIINAYGINNGSYNFASGNFDNLGFIYLKNPMAGPGVFYFSQNFFARYTDSDAGNLAFRYVATPFSYSFIRQFNAGDQIIAGARVNATGAPAAPWEIQSVTGYLIRIK